MSLRPARTAAAALRSRPRLHGLLHLRICLGPGQSSTECACSGWTYASAILCICACGPSSDCMFCWDYDSCILSWLHIFPARHHQELTTHVLYSGKGA